jgi:deferrochelatase/peroxidase EfeB
VRRANPRSADLPGGRQSYLERRITDLGLRAHAFRDDLIASSRFHRILRRGREYGTPVKIDDAIGGRADAAARGLHFICLNANIARQFEFVQNAWIMSATFNGLDGEADPLLGNRVRFPPGVSTDGFSLPQPEGLTRRLCGLPRFVTLRGGAYFFMPGLRALTYLAR